MRKVTAILLLPIMVIFAMQPVIAMHYCGGELRSLDLFAQQIATHPDTGRTTVHRNSYSCCDSHRAETTGHHGNELYATADKCCDITILELTTDDYQSKVEQLIPRTPLLSVDSVVAILTGLSRLPDADADIRPPLQHFPPGGHFLKDVSILTYICIYRI